MLLGTPFKRYFKKGEIMYEILIKLEKELEYRKYTIQDLKEIKKILKELKAEEIKIDRVKER